MASSSSRDDSDLITPAAPKAAIQARAAPVGVSSSSSASTPSSTTTDDGAVERQAGSPLLNLPLDVLALIFETCDWPSAVALRRTCRTFRGTFPVGRTISKADEYRAALAAGDNGSFPAPCYGCLRVLSMAHFPRSWPGVADAPPPRGRRCTGCALASALLPPGARYESRGTPMVLCRRCGRHRPERGRWTAPEAPAGHCPRCRRLRGFVAWLAARRHSASFWAVLTCLGILTLTAFTFRASVLLWSVLPHDDRAVQDFALFTAIYQSIVQLAWLLVFTIARFLPQQNRWRRKAFSVITGTGIVAEMFVEFALLLVACCMPFTMGYFASLRVTAWATLTWCVASFGAIMRMLAEDDLKRP